jgi:hypothetical protein
MPPGRSRAALAIHSAMNVAESLPAILHYQTSIEPNQLAGSVFEPTALRPIND